MSFLDDVLALFGLGRPRDPDAEEANAYAQSIVRELTRSGKCYVKKTKDGQIFQQVRIVPPIKVLPDRVELQINARDLPYGVNITELKDGKIVEGIGTALERPVTVKHGRGTGFWYVVRRTRGAMKPNFFYTDLTPPANYDPRQTPLLIPIGRDDNGDLIWRDLELIYHLLIGGATGMGKTSLLHSVICWLIHHAPPSHAQLILVDLKEGLDFSRYDGVPHLIHPVGIRPEQAHQYLKWINDEIGRRGQLFRDVRAENIDTYRKRSKDFLNNIVFVFDEIANLEKLKLMGSPESEAEAWFWLRDGAQRARALGIHFIISTQRPSAKIIDGDIKMNFTARIGLGTATDVDSRVILDNNMATGLDIGDLVYQDSRNRGVLLRGPYTPTDYADVVVEEVIKHYEQAEAREAREAELEEQRQEQLRLDLIKYALENNEGRFSVEPLYEVFQDRITMDNLKQTAIYLEEMDILSPARGKRPRMVVGYRLSEGKLVPSDKATTDKSGPIKDKGIENDS